MHALRPTLPWALALVSSLHFASPLRAQDPTPPVQDPEQGTQPTQEPVPVEPPAALEPKAAGTPQRSEVILDLTLEQALKIAIDNDLQLQIASVSTEVASYQYAASWGSFDPTLTATAAVTDSEFQGSSSLSGASVLQEDTQELSANLNFPLTTGGQFDLNYARVNTKTNNSFQLVNPSTSDTLGVSYRQPLLRGAWKKYATSRQREAEIEYRMSLERFRQARQQLLLDVHTAYWDLVATIQQLAVADETLELGRRQMDQNQRRLDAGVGTEVEVLQADANVARRIEERLLADVQVRAAQDLLKAKLFPGTDPVTWDTMIAPVTELPDSSNPMVPPWNSALAVAIENRAELREQRLEIDANDVRLERARSEKQYGLDLELSSRARGFDGDSWDAFQSATSFEFPANRAALTLDLPFGNRTAKNAERVVRSLGRSARLRYAQLESEITAEVRDAVRRILYSAEAVKAAVKSLSLAQRQLAAEEARYAEGLSTNFQVLEFQQQLAEARTAEKRARVAYAKALAQLAKAEGVLGERETR